MLDELNVNDLATLGVKALNGGAMVVVFSLVAEVLKPKRFAGLFSAAPSVAIANLTVTGLVDGKPHMLANTSGMVVGAVAMGLACAAGIWLVPHLKTGKASVGIVVVWALVAIAGWQLLP